MMHVSDWLPTLYTVAGGDSSRMGSIDGMDLWKALYANQTSPRSEILHNIDPLIPFAAALRIGDYKLILGDPGMDWSGWYPPWGLADDKIKTNNNINTNNKYSNSDFEVNYLDIKVQGRQNRFSVTLHCGKKPFNASTNCYPVVKPCLFNIAKDPCEYYNIADDNREIVNLMLIRLQDYNRTMVPPGNQPEDPTGNPKYYNDTWIPWIKLS